jgi:hypothetical protein
LEWAEGKTTSGKASLKMTGKEGLGWEKNAEALWREGADRHKHLNLKAGQSHLSGEHKGGPGYDDSRQQGRS